MTLASRRSFRLVTATALAVSLLSGCSTIKNVFDGRGKDHSKDPAKLVQISPSVSVSKLWSASVGKGEEKLGIAQRPAIADGHVYAAAVEGGVSAFDLRSGQSLWRYASELPLTGGPGAGDGLVVVGSMEGDVIALDAATGAEKWKAKVANEVLVAPAVGGGLVFVHSNDGRSELDRMADVDGPAVLDNTTLYATSYKNHTVAIDGPSGQLMWDRENGGPRGLGLSYSAVVVTDPTGKVWGLDRNSGGSLWQQDGLAYRNTTAPAVQGDYAVVGDLEGVIHWLRLNDGAFAARSSVGGAVTGQPAVADGILVVQTIEGQLAAFSIQ